MKKMYRTGKGKMRRILAVVMAVLMVFSVVYVSDRQRKAEAEGTGLTAAPEGYTDTDYLAQMMTDLDPGKAYTVTLPVSGVNFKLPDISETLGQEGWQWQDAGGNPVQDGQITVTNESATYTIRKAVTEAASGEGETTEAGSTEAGSGNAEEKASVTVQAKAPSAVTVEKKEDGTVTLTDPDAVSAGDNSFYYGAVRYALVKASTDGTYPEPSESDCHTALADIQAELNGTAENGTYKIYKLISGLNQKDETGAILPEQPDLISGEDLASEEVTIDRHLFSISSTDNGTGALSAGSDGTLTYTISGANPKNPIRITVKPVEGVTVTAGTADGKTELENKDNVFEIPGAVGQNLTAAAYTFTGTKGGRTERISVKVTYINAVITLQNVKVSNAVENGNIYYVKDSTVTIQGTVSLPAGLTGAALRAVLVDENGTAAGEISGFVEKTTNVSATAQINGEKKLRLKVYSDTYGTEAVSAPFKVAQDTAGPEIESLTVSQKPKKNESTYSYLVGAGGTVSGKISSREDVTLTFSATDTDSGMNTDKVQVLEDGKEGPVAETSREEGTIRIPEGALFGEAGNKVTFRLRVFDKVGNTSEKSFTLDFYRDAVTIATPVITAVKDRKASVKDSGNETKIIANGGFTMTFQVTSDAPVNEKDISLKANGEEIKENAGAETSGMEIEKSTDSADAFKVIYTFSGKETVKWDEVVFSVANENGVTETSRIKVIQIDVDVPDQEEIETTPEKGQNATTQKVGDKDWYSALLLHLYYNSDSKGNQTKISITGVDNDGEAGALSFDTTGDYATDRTVSVLPSSSAAGTDVKIYARDEAGNGSLTENPVIAATYYVDNEAPEISAEDGKGLTVKRGDKTVSHDSFILPGDNPEIQFTSTDNIGVYNSEIIITKPDGREVKKTYAPDEADLGAENTADFSSKEMLKSLLKAGADAKLPAGKYTVTCQVTDYAGNQLKSAPSISFTVDDKVPDVSLEVQKKDGSSAGTITGGTSADPVITYTVTDDCALQGYSLKAAGPTVDAKQTTGTKQEDDLSTDADRLAALKEGETITLASLLQIKDGNAPDGKYTVTLDARDVAGNTKSKKAEFSLDNTAPSVTDISLKQKNPANTEESIGLTGNDSAKKAAKHLTSTRDFTIEFHTEDPTVNDVQAGIDSVSVRQKIGDGKETSVYSKNEAGDQSFTVQRDTAMRGKTVVYTITVTDKVGNQTVKTVSLDFSEETVKVTNRRVDILPRNWVSALNATDKNKFDIIYTISSDVKLAAADKQVVTINGNKMPAASGTLQAVKADAAGNSYEYTYTYHVNEPTSAVLNHISFTAENENGVKSVANDLPILNIDAENPVIGNSSAAENTWYQTLMIRVPVADGSRPYVSGIQNTFVTGDVSAVTYGNGWCTAMVNPSANEKDMSRVTVRVKDKVNRETVRSFRFGVDATVPVTSLSVTDSGTEVTDGGYIGTSPVIRAVVNDNIRLSDWRLRIICPNGAVVNRDIGFYDKDNAIDIGGTLENLLLAKAQGSTPNPATDRSAVGAGGYAMDGKYTVTLTAEDLAGNESDILSRTFWLDRTVPVTSLTVTTENPAKYDQYCNQYDDRYAFYGQYYNRTVVIRADYKETNGEDPVLTDNGSVITPDNGSWAVNADGSFSGTFSITAEGTHDIRINATDYAGNQAAEHRLLFTIDRTAPVISAALNGSAFPAGAAERFLNTQGNLEVRVSDSNKDAADLLRVVTVTPPAGNASESQDYVQEGQTAYTTNADYTVTYTATDLAGNVSAPYTVTFRVDTVKPELSISGVSEKGTATKDVTLTFSMQEAFYRDMLSSEIESYRAIDGESEKLLKQEAFRASGASTSMQKTFTDDGEYRFRFTAEDRAGNKAETAYTFILDSHAPVISLQNVKNYDKTNKDVNFGLTVTESFYRTNTVELKGTVTGIDGKKKNIEFGARQLNTGRESRFSQIFKEDGIYDITVTSTDKAGNRTVKKIHFTIDKTKPEIRDQKAYDGTTVSAFSVDADDPDLVKDLTTCDVSIYLDGVLYDGTTELADGSHDFTIEAKDELGNERKKTWSFVLDTTPPAILVSGVEDGDVVREPVDISVSLQDRKDTLDSVTLNGRTITVAGNQASTKVSQPGNYEITAKAHDEAGNEKEITLSFRYGTRVNWALIGGIAGGVILAAVVILLMAGAKRRKNAAKSE